VKTPAQAESGTAGTQTPLGRSSERAAPYRNALFERIAAEPDFEPRVFFLHPQDSLRGWTSERLGFPAEFVPCWTPERLYSWPGLGGVNPSLSRRIEAFGPDVLLIYGHAYWTQWQAMRWAVRRGAPYFLRCDSNLNNLAYNRRGGKARWSALKTRILRRWVRTASGALTIGRANDRYWAHMGVPEQKRFLAPFAVDNDFFTGAAERFRKARETLQAEMGIGGGRVLLFAGRLIPEKNLHRLLRAWGRCGLAGARLLVAGSGPLEDELRGLAASLGLRNAVFHGFQDQQGMARLYAAADALILPSLSERWGLVVNEAMASGLPVFVSGRCGCVPDLVQHGVNGWRFDPADDASLEEALDRFGRLPDADLRQWGEASRAIISRWNHSETIAGFRRAFRSTAACGEAAR